MAATKTTIRLATRLRTDLLKVTDQQTRDLVAAWARAWDEVAGDLDAAIQELAANADAGIISRSAVLRSNRLRFALDGIARQLTRLGEDAGVRIIGDLADVVRQAGAAQEAIIASQLPRSERDQLRGWDRVDSRQVEAIVQRSTERITSDMWPLSSDSQAVIRREIVRGLAAGTNPRATARRIVQRAQSGFNGGLTRALTISRTETLSAHREAARLAHMANADVLAGWRWQCALSSRTCPACLAKNGELFPVDTPGPDGHPNCRCARSPVTKSWRDLGIDLDEPASVFPDARAWFSEQPDSVQLKIMGSQRLALLKSGDVAWSDLATKKRNPEWRDSWQVTPVKNLGRRQAA
jgi:SPP1 gp7 family putative phage head morphogenesis protein